MLLPLTPVVTFVAVNLVGNGGAKILVFLSGPEGWSENFLTYVVVPWAAAYCAVVLTAAMAPRRQAVAAITVSTLALAAIGFGSVFLVVTAAWKGLLALVPPTIGFTVPAIEMAVKRVGDSASLKFVPAKDAESETTSFADGSADGRPE